METRKLAEITPYDRNPRKNDGAVDRVLESLNRHGQVKPIVLSAKGKPFAQETVVAGHTTLRALERFGAKEAFVVVKEFADEAQFVDYNLRDNKTSEFAEWDEQELANLSAEFDISLDEMGFEDFDIEEESEGNTDEDAVPEVPEEPTAKLGQMWKLGDHRLMCGDSTDRAQVEALMGGEKADMVYTDPPYGMSLDVDYDKMFKGDDHKKTGDRFSKVIADDEYFDPSKILSMFDSLKIKEVFLWGADYFYDSLPRGGSLCGWDKRTTDQMDKVVGNTTEFIWSKVPHKRMTARVLWSGHHGMGKDDEKKRVHPTQKPIELHEWFFENFGSKKNIVLDIFGGSGSTLIACEKTKRKCRMMELDPKYCDVIIKRWEDFTGKKAELL
jgi:DNA modification methylase